MAVWNIQSIVESMESSDWEDTFDGDRQERRVFLGTVFSLTPSGKYYLPFACSNVEPCPRCKGSGSVGAHRSLRVRKRNQARLDWSRRPRQQAKHRARRERNARLGLPARNSFFFDWKTWQRHAHGVTCDFCGGCGSREAYLDEQWNEEAEAELNEVGYSLCGGEGDPCDLFAVESRDRPDDEDEDGDGDEGGVDASAARA